MENRRGENRIAVFKRLELAAVLAVSGLLLIYAAKRAGEGFWSSYPAFSRAVTGALAWMTSFTPFTLWEGLSAALIVFVVVRLILGIKKNCFWVRLSGVVLLLSAGSFAFLAVWGLNYYAPSMAGRVGLSEQLYTTEELAQAVTYYMDKAEEWADDVPRGADGQMTADIGQLAPAANQGYDALCGEIPDFDGSRARVKTLVCSPAVAKVGTTGIFVAFTGESGVSSKVYTAAMPFTICHELAHRLSFAREDEANFAAYLACEASSDPSYVYSGYYLAFIYCYNALYSADPRLALKTSEGIGPLLAFDLNATNAHYDSLRNEKAEKVYDAVYDQYLKTMDVESGIQSYGEVVDLLTMWYFQRIAQ